MRLGGAWARVAWIALACIAGAAQAQTVPSLEEHVLERTGYGADGWSRQRIATLGVDAYLEEQLHPESIADTPLETRIAGYGSLSRSLAELMQSDAGSPDAPLSELSRARLLRAALSRRQLQEQLVDFWFDHFNVFGSSGRTMALAVLPYERDAIRPHVLGRFEDLLRAVARSPAMLYYLDNFLNVKQGFVSPSGPREGLNENYARELLELHTVGTASGFTQADVIAAARALTGWMVQLPPGGDPDSFFFYGESHDRNAKRVLGLALLPGRGIEDGLGLLIYLAAHPSTAQHLCRELVERFVYEPAPVLLVNECARVFLSSHGDLEQVMHEILFSPQFRDPRLRATKLKRPMVFVASLLRATAARPSDEQLDVLLGYLTRLGEAPYQAHPPTGYPERSSYWSSAGSLLTRFELVTTLTDADAAYGVRWGLPSVVPTAGADALVDLLAQRLLAAAPAPATRAAVVARVGAVGAKDRVREAAALLLASPDFMWH